VKANIIFVVDNIKQMETIFINRNTNEFNAMSEIAYYYNSYLISDGSAFCTYLSSFIYWYQNISKWKANYIIDRFKLDMPEREGLMKDDTVELIKSYYNQLRHVKRLNKDQLTLKNRVDASINNMKGLLELEYKQKLLDLYAWEWVSLFDQESMISLVYKEYLPDHDKEEDVLIETISDIFLDDECKKAFLMLPGTVYMHQKECSVTDEKSQIEKPDFYSLRLYQIPYFPLLPKETLRMIRSDLLRKSSVITERLNEFKLQIQNDVFSEKVKEHILEFNNNIKEEMEKFRDAIGKQLYLMQALNAGGAYGLHNVNLGVGSIETIIDHYGKANVLLPFVYDALKNKMSRQTDIKKCYPFLFITPGTPPEKPE
jgi:hypothetical protein